MNKHVMMLIRMEQRMPNAEKLQKVLSLYGCNIRTRLGLHEAGEVCGVDGLIILQLVPTDKDFSEFAAQLNAIDGVTAKIAEI